MLPIIATRAGALVAAALTAACATSLAPYETTPRAPLAGPGQNIPRIGVCYSALFSTPEEVREVAEEACSGIGTPQLVEQDLRLACPLLTPARATFACVPP